MRDVVDQRIKVVTALPAFGGGLTAEMTVPSTTAFQSAGGTLGEQFAVKGSVWRVRAFGQYVAASSPLPRNAQAACFWGVTQLAILSAVVTPSVAAMNNFVLEFSLVATSDGVLSVSGVLTGSANGSNPTNLSANLAAMSTVVGMAQQVIDLRFSMSSAAVSDKWLIDGVTIERVNTMPEVKRLPHP